MALADLVESTPPRRPSGNPCSVAELIAKLDGTPEGDALHEMMYVRGWSGERIYKAVKDEGHSVGKQTINRHRSQSCRCFL